MTSFKALTVTVVAVASAVALFAVTQTWVSFMLDGVHSLETVSGSTANAALSPVAIATLIAALVLTIARPVFRRVLGGLLLVLGVGFAVLAVDAATQIDRVLATPVAELTGLTGTAARQSVVWAAVSGWPWAAVVSAALIALCGVAVLFFSGSWRVAGRKYDAQPGRLAAESSGSQHLDNALGSDVSAHVPGSPHGEDRIADWDSLSAGDDPTT